MLLLNPDDSVPLFSVSRFFSRKLYSGVDREHASLLSTCRFQIVNRKNIELCFSHRERKRKILFEPATLRRGIARLLSSNDYRGSYQLDDSRRAEFVVTGQAPQISAKCNYDEMILTSAVPAGSSDFEYVINSRKYGVLVYIYRYNYFSLKDAIASRLGWGLVPLGILDRSRMRECAESEIDDLYEILFGVLFCYLIIIPSIMPSDAGSDN